MEKEILNKWVYRLQDYIKAVNQSRNPEAEKIAIVRLLGYLSSLESIINQNKRKYMSKRNSFTQDYEFTVTKREDWDNESIFGYSVYLPHQCDEWEIIGAEDESDIPSVDSYPKLPQSKELAINQMELFIKRANEALEKLKELD